MRTLSAESAARRARAKARVAQSSTAQPPSAAVESAAGAPAAPPPAVPAFTGKIVERAFLAPPTGGIAAGESGAPPKKISRFLAKRRGALDLNDDEY